MTLLVLTCLVGAVSAGLWSRDAFALSVTACNGKSVKALTRAEKSIAGRQFILGHGYGALALLLAVIAGFALGRAL